MNKSTLAMAAVVCWLSGGARGLAEDAPDPAKANSRAVPAEPTSAAVTPVAVDSPMPVGDPRHVALRAAMVIKVVNPDEARVLLQSKAAKLLKQARSLTLWPGSRARMTKSAVPPGRWSTNARAAPRG